MQELFRTIATHISKGIGSIWTVLIFILLIVSTGYYFHFSSEWINDTSLITTVTSLLVLFFLQKSQNHSDKATHLKLDELIRAVEGARNEVASIEHKPEEHINKLNEDAE